MPLVDGFLYSASAVSLRVMTVIRKRARILMITRSLSRWHSRSSAWLGSISYASTTKRRSSAGGIHTITISASTQ